VPVQAGSPANRRVDLEVVRKKFDFEVRSLLSLEDEYRRRGWWIRRIDFPEVEVAFASQFAQFVVVPVAVRISFDNYDLDPPSLRFIHPISGEPSLPSVNEAWLETKEGLEQIFIGMHPTTQQPFLCVPGTREYHSHPQHDGDSWFLHRTTGEGRLVTLLERVWQSMIFPYIGLAFQIALPMPNDVIAAIPQLQVGFARRPSSPPNAQ
jgi:hypothetical protein